MAWKIEFDPGAERELSKLDPPIARRLLGFLRDRLATLDDPRSIGEALKGSKLGAFWMEVPRRRLLDHCQYWGRGSTHSRGAHRKPQGRLQTLTV